jgi:hypothetical protein
MKRLRSACTKGRPMCFRIDATRSTRDDDDAARRELTGYARGLNAPVRRCAT